MAKPRRLRLRRVLWLVGAVAVLGLIPIAVSAVRVASLSAGRTFEPDEVPERGVAMVLGARADPGRPSAFLAARLDVAVDLYERGKVRAVLVTGDGLPRSHNEPAVMRDYLVARGVPAERIVEDPAGFDTYDSCVRARDVYGVEELTIVTQDYHLPRAIAICREIGVDAVGVADTTMLGRFPLNWIKGAGREWAANLKMEWDLISGRQPQRDAFDPSLQQAAAR